MADLRKANELLRSAEDLFEKKDFAGVAGSAYQAFEVGVIALGRVIKEDLRDHVSRRKKVEKLLGVSKETMKKLWVYRNVDFYGNEAVGEEERDLNEEEIEESLNIVRNLLNQIGNLIKEWK